MGVLGGDNAGFPNGRRLADDVVDIEEQAVAGFLKGKKVPLGEGAFFGEMALLGNTTRSANITTTRVSRLLVLDLVDFRLLMARHPELGQTIDAEAKRRALENK